MSGAVILATYSDGQLRVFTRTNGDGLRPRAVLDVEGASPDLLATMAADMADALGWLPAARPTPQRAERAEPAAPVKRKHRPRAEVDAIRDALVAAVRTRPGVTTVELAASLGLVTKDASNLLDQLRRAGRVRGTIDAPRRGTPQHWRAM